MNRAPRHGLWAAWGLACGLTAVAEPPASRPTAEDLDSLVHAYFTQDDRSERRKLAFQIEALPDVTIETVAEAIQRVQVWEPQRTGRDDFTVRTAAGDSRVIRMHVPDGYDPSRSYPLLIALHGQRASAAEFVEFVLQWLGEQRDEFLVAAPRDYPGAVFGAKPQLAWEPLDWLAALRRRYHVDTDRVYAIGESSGGEAACHLAAFYSSWFAGAVSLSGTLVTPYPRQSREFLLPNLAHTPLLLVWGDQDRTPIEPFAQIGIAESNRHICKLAERLQVPIECVELDGVGPRAVSPPAKPFFDLLARRRDSAPRAVSHWFRYPAQGRVAWLRQTRFDGAMWEASELAVRVPADGDFDAYCKKTLQDKLAYVGGRVTGQRIELETTHTASVELRLPDSLIDFDQPVVLLLNGTKRLEGRVLPRIITLLELAYEDWEFQTLTPVRITIGKDSLARQPF
jgi:predicted esterase